MAFDPLSSLLSSRAFWLGLFLGVGLTELAHYYGPPFPFGLITFVLALLASIALFLTGREERITRRVKP